MITSINEWEGKIEEDTECIMMIKTQKKLGNELTTYIKGVHGYDVPEVISVPIDSDEGNQDYLSWVRDMTKSNKNSI